MQFRLFTELPLAVQDAIVTALSKTSFARTDDDNVVLSSYASYIGNSVEQRDSTGLILRASGLSSNGTPDDSTGFVKGAYYTIRDADGNGVYMNIGDDIDAVWSKVDESTGSGEVVTANIADGAITNPKIADLAVSEGKLEDNAVTNAKIATGAVGSTNIADGAVGTTQMSDGSVVTAKLADGGVTNQKMDPNAVDFTMIENAMEADPSSDPAPSTSSKQLILPATYFDGTQSQLLKLFLKNLITYNVKYAAGQPLKTLYDAVNQRLFVVDANNNRVLVYDLSSGVTNGMDATWVIGQPDLYTTSYGTSALNLKSPISIALDPNNNLLYVSDRQNYRVLVFDVTPGTFASGQNAVHVLGQSTFSSGSAPVAAADNVFGNPNGLDFDATNSRLFVTDTGYNRILIFDTTSLSDGMSAINVEGQSLMTTSGHSVTQTGLYGPSGVCYDDGNKLIYVADTNNNRVVSFNVDPLTIVDGDTEVHVYGQPDFVTNTQNTTQASLLFPSDVTLDVARQFLLVSDTSNNRIPLFDINPGTTSDGENATWVMGQVDYIHGGPNLTQYGFTDPVGIYYDNTNLKLYVADSQNNRVEILDMTALYNNIPAVNVIGQMDYTHALPGSSSPYYRFSLEDNSHTEFASIDNSGNLVFNANLVTPGNMTAQTITSLGSFVGTLQGQADRVPANFRVSAGDETLSSASETLWSDTSSAAITYTLPAAAGFTGYKKIYVASGANNVILNVAGSDTITDSSGTGNNTETLTNPHVYTLWSDGTSTWYMIQG